MNRMKQINYLSYLRAVSCIAIIVLHTVNAALMLYGDGISPMQNIAADAVVHCMMFAVPVFVMVTGALLLSKEKEVTLKRVFSKYILRVFLALLLFSLIFSLFDTLMNKDGAGILFLLRGLWNTLTGRGWAHLWYLYLLIGLYLFLIFYRAIAHHVSDREFRYLLLVYAIFLSLIPLLSMWNIPFGFYIHTATIYPFFLFAGYGIARDRLKIRRWLSVLMMIAGLAGMVFSVFWNLGDPRVSKGNLLSYSSVFVLLLSLGIFALFQSFDTGKIRIRSKQIDRRTMVYEAAKPNFFGRILLEIDRCSFGIYLIHLIFVRLILRYFQVNPWNFEVTSVLIFAGIVLAELIVSYGITALLKLIPGIRQIL